MNHRPTQFNKEDLFQLLKRRFIKFSDVIPTKDDSATRNHYLQMANANIIKISNLVETFDLIGSAFWGYGINIVSNGQEEYSNFDLTDIEKKNGFNRHIYYDEFHFLIFKIFEDHLFVNTFAMLVGRSIIKSENLVKIHMSNFKSAGFTTEGQKIFVNYNFDGLPKKISFQIDPYVDSLNFAKYYIDSIELLASKKPNQDKLPKMIGTLNVFGGQVNIGDVINEIKS